MSRQRVDKALTATDGEKTRGDTSDRTATGGEPTLGLSMVETSQPSIWRQDQSAALIGDITVRVNAEGKAEEVLEPPQNLKDSYRIYRLSPFLASIIEAFVINVYGSEYTFKPKLDLDDPATPERVKAALEFERSDGDFDSEDAVKPEEVKEEISRIRRRMAREFEFLKVWFANCTLDMSYYSLCVLTGQDKHIGGTGYWEILRDVEGKPKRAIWSPAWSIRAKPQGKALVVSKRPARVSSLHWEEEVYVRRFRSYVQIDNSSTVVARFKEYGDPRIMSRLSGKYYNTQDEMIEAERQEVNDKDGNTVFIDPLPATELLDFKIPYSGCHGYGKPKWTSVYPDLIGLRDLSEENRLVVTDQAIPNMVILIAGGRMEQADVDRIEEKIESRKPGEKKIVVIQAYDQRNTPAGPSVTPSISIEKTKDVQNTDILGLNYIKQGERSIQRAYRMPKVGLGDTDGVNRATMFGAFRFTEDQVYDPERFEFKDRINTTLLPDLDIQHWEYEPQSRAPRDPELLSIIVERLARAGAITPEESREIAEQILNRQFKDIDSLWNRLPVTILNAILQTKNQVTAAALLSESKDEQGDSPELLGHMREALLADFQAAGLKLSGLKLSGQNPNPSSKEKKEENAKTGQSAEGGDNTSKAE